MSHRWTETEWKKVEELWQSSKPKNLKEFRATLEKVGIHRTQGAIWFRIREFVKAGLYPGNYQALQIEVSRATHDLRTERERRSHHRNGANGQAEEGPETAGPDDETVILDAYGKGLIPADVAIRMIAARRR